MTTPSDIVMTAAGLERRFGYRRVFSGVDLTLRSGEAVVLMGPNGAGKTTLLRVLAGLATPGVGSVTVNGRVEMVGHQPMVYDTLTAEENLAFFARLAGSANGRTPASVLDEVGLADRAGDRVGSFSHGMRQRVAIARALLSDPDVLLMDEPFNGLDDRGAATVLEILREFRNRRGAILLVTHDTSRVGGLGTGQAFLAGGTLIGPEPLESPEALGARYRELVGHE